jgi:hypothetical protein
MPRDELSGVRSTEFTLTPYPRTGSRASVHYQETLFTPINFNDGLFIRSQLYSRKVDGPLSSLDNVIPYRVTNNVRHGMQI